MIRRSHRAPLTRALSGDGVIELTESDVPEMMALAEPTKPGPFGRRTRELGTYIGIRRSGTLVAMAGERLRLPGFTEVSAVCTHLRSRGAILERRIEHEGAEIGDAGFDFSSLDL